MSKYRHSFTLTGELIPESSAQTLDQAIHQAHSISRRIGGQVYVSDTSEYPRRVRGFAHTEKWTWMVKCATCKATGNRRRKGGGADETCDRCWGYGMRPES